MKKLSLISILVLTTGLLFAKPFSKGATLYVAAQDVKLRKSESPLSTVIQIIDYGEMCIVLESNDKNTKVQMCSPDKEEGWISNASLTKKKITSTGKKSANISSDELAMAGKGFSAAAEEAFRQSNSDLNYDEVDSIELINISDEDTKNFIKEGHLKGGDE